MKFGLNLTKAVDWIECRYFNDQSDVREALPKRLADKKRPLVENVYIIFSEEAQALCEKIQHEFIYHKIYDAAEKRLVLVCKKDFFTETSIKALIKDADGDANHTAAEIRFDKTSLIYLPTQRYLQSFKPSLCCFRYMDLQCINSSELENFENRSSENGFTADLAKGGLSIERLVYLAQIFDVTPWFCIPHLTYERDPEFVAKFCKLLKKLLNGKKFILEFSNELWNFAPFFKQSRIALRVGEEKAAPEIKNKLAYGSAIMQTDMARKAKEVCGDQVECVLAGWANSIKYNELLLKYADTSLFKHFAVAPYFGNSVFPKNKGEDGPESKEEILRLLKESMDDRLDKFKQIKDLTEAKKLTLCCYEMNHHMVDKSGKDRHIEATLYPEMEDLIYEYLERIYKISPDGIHCFFQSGPHKHSSHNSWSIIREYGEYTPIRNGIHRFLLNQG